MQIVRPEGLRCVNARRPKCLVDCERFDLVSNFQGTGEYVGWRSGVQVNPLITFDFARPPVIDAIDISQDNRGFGGVFAPTNMLINGVDRPFTAPTLGTIGRDGSGSRLTIGLLVASWLSFSSKFGYQGATGTSSRPSGLPLRRVVWNIAGHDFWNVGL